MKCCSCGCTCAGVGCTPLFSQNRGIGVLLSRPGSAETIRLLLQPPCQKRTEHSPRIASAEVIPPAEGDWIDVEWPCQAEDGGAVAKIWFKVLVAAVDLQRSKYLLRFSDGEEAWNSLRKIPWRSVPGQVQESVPSEPPELQDASGFVYSFTIEEEFLEFCDGLHAHRQEVGDKSRGDSEHGEPLCGGLISVLVRRDALPEKQKDMYNRLHQICIEEVPKAWPGWIQKAAGKAGKARPSQDLRLLQYFEGAQFKAHVDSGWACQALIYLNEDFRGGCTEFPNLRARYRPKRGRVLMWRSVSVGFKGTIPGSMEDHPAQHVANEVFGGTKKVVPWVETYVMMGCVLYFFAIIATALIGKRQPFMEHIYEPGQLTAEELFGDVVKSMFTLFQLMTLDSWTGFARPLIAIESWTAFFFIFFISVAVFVMMNLVTAVIVENAFAENKSEEKELAVRLEREKEEELEDLKNFFLQVDIDGSGSLTKQEFFKATKQRKVRQKLRALDIMPKDIDELWDILDSGMGELKAEEFVHGIRRLRGEARA
eukprot:s2735_g10.t1